MEHYRKVKIIGKGSFAQAVLVQSTKDHKHYIMKVVDVSRMDRKQKEEALNEVLVLKRLRHPYIVTYRESFMERRNLCIVMDYANGGDLYQRIAKQKKLGCGFNEDQILDWFVQMCLALKHIHDRNILHRDLKTQNIFLGSTGDVKIGDFGIAKVLQQPTDLAQTAIGTPYYLSPEICQEKAYNHKSDIWSLGCILYEMVTLRHAFDANSMKRLVVKIMRGTYQAIPSIYSRQLQVLIGELLQKDPDNRPSIKEVLEKDFIRTRISAVIAQSVTRHESMKPEEEKKEAPPLYQNEPATSSESEEEEEEDNRSFLTPEGRPVPGLAECDSVYSRLEALRAYLEERMGVEDFVRAYEFLKDPPHDEGLKGILSPEKMKFVPLVYQAIVCEETVFNEV